MYYYNEMQHLPSVISWNLMMYKPIELPKTNYPRTTSAVAPLNISTPRNSNSNMMC